MKIKEISLPIRIFLALLAAGLIATLVALPRSSGSKAADFPCALKKRSSVNISIASGEPGSSIAQSLYRAGVIKSSESYFRLAVGDKRSQFVAPGNHRIDKGICAREALNQLLDSKRITGLISIVEGAWLSEIIPQISAAHYSQSEILLALRIFKKPLGFTSLEGLFFPAQYSFEEGTPISKVIDSMVGRALAEMKSANFFEDTNQFSPEQLLIIASLVQAEGNTKDFSRISQVVRNRLKIGMPLQFDSTVHYIKKSRGSVFLSTQSTLISSPYNTYRKYGLPPGPINNPGAEAMYAATHPEPGNWLYFITVAPFDTRFTDNLSQFNIWKIEYEKNLKAGKFGRSQ